MPKRGEKWSPEQRAKIIAAKERRRLAMADVPKQEAEPVVLTARMDSPPPPRQPLQAQPKRSGSRWQMKAGRWDDDALDLGGDEGVNALDIPKELHPDGITLQWVTRSVYGQEQTQHRAGFERTGWLQVYPEDFDGAFDGMFAPRGSKEPINKDGLDLVAKPTEMVEKSRRIEKRKAREQVSIKEQALYGGEMNAMGADHESARKFNHIRKTVERISVPEE